MAITINTDLDSQVPAGNPDWLRLKTDNYVAAAGTLGVWVFEINGQPAVDKTLTFTFGEYEIILTTKNTADASGYQTNRPNDTATMTAFVACLNLNYLLSKYFVITDGGWTSGVGKFTITQREKTTDTVLTYAFESGSNVAYTATGSTAPVAPSYQPNFKLKCEILHRYDFTDLTKLRTAATLEGVPKLVGSEWQVDFNFQKILRSLVNFDKPAYGETTHSLCDSMIAYYGYKIMESYGEPILPYYMQDFSQTGTPYATVLSREPFAIHGAETWNTRYTSAAFNKFLHNRPTLLQTNADANQYLYSYVKSGKTQSRTYIKVYYEDGTDSGDTLVRTLSHSGTYKGRIMRTNAGYNALGVGALDPSKIVDYYEVWIADSSILQVTEKYKFSVDFSKYEHNNYILFSNPLGGFDTAWLRGELGFNKEYFGIDTVNAILPGYTQGNMNSQNTGEQWQYEFNSGQLASKEELRWMAQIAQAEEVYYIGATDYVKLIVDRKSVDPVDNTMESLNAFSFKARVANLEI